MIKTAAIVAMAENRVIGNKNQLPWHLPEDLQYFKRVTMNKPIVMGRLTFESIGRPLPGRRNVVVSRQAHWSYRDVLVANNLPAAIELAKTEAREAEQDELMIIGGADIYRQALPLLDVIYLTQIHDSPPGDAWFPEVDWSEWREVSRSERQRAANGGVDFSFIIFQRQAWS